MSSNFSNSALPLYMRNALNDTDTSSSVTVTSTQGGGVEDGSANGWPVPPFFAIVNPNTSSQEVVKVTAKTGSGATTQYSITRGSSLGSESLGSQTKAHNAWSVIIPSFSASDAMWATAAAGLLTGGGIIENEVASSIGLEIVGASGQSADIFCVRNYADTSKFVIDSASGMLLEKPGAIQTIRSTTGDTYLILEGLPDTNRGLVLRSLDDHRFTVTLSAGGEGGSNAGSNLIINRYADNGTFLSTIMQVFRDTGKVEFYETVNFQDATEFDSNIVLDATPAASNHVVHKSYVDTKVVQYGSYTPLSFVAWQNYPLQESGAGWIKEPSRYVNLQGLVSPVGVPSPGQAIAVINSQDAPAIKKSFVINVVPNGNITVSINNAGVISVEAINTNSTPMYADLSSIRYLPGT